eukprot:1691370-Amphidinium_carterae.3
MLHRQLTLLLQPFSSASRSSCLECRRPKAQGSKTHEVSSMPGLADLSRATSASSNLEQKTFMPLKCSHPISNVSHTSVSQ